MASSGAHLGLSTSKLLLIFTLSIGVEAVLYEPTGDVFVLDDSNFANNVFNSDKIWFVEFFSSWCGHCINFAPTWKSFAKDLQGE